MSKAQGHNPSLIETLASDAPEQTTSEGTLPAPTSPTLASLPPAAPSPASFLLVEAQARADEQSCRRRVEAARNAGR